MGISPDNSSSLYVMSTRHKNQDGLRLYTQDLNEMRTAAKTSDEKTSAISLTQGRVKERSI